LLPRCARLGPARALRRGLDGVRHRGLNDCATRVARDGAAERRRDGRVRGRRPRPSDGAAFVARRPLRGRGHRGAGVRPLRLAARSGRQLGADLRAACRGTSLTWQEFLNERPIAVIATPRADGTPHAVPVEVLVRDDKVYCWSQATSQKARNAARAGKAAIVGYKGHAFGSTRGAVRIISKGEPGYEQIT